MGAQAGFGPGDGKPKAQQGGKGEHWLEEATEGCPTSVFHSGLAG